MSKAKKLEEIRAMGCELHGIACQRCVDPEDMAAAVEWLFGEVDELLSVMRACASRGCAECNEHQRKYLND